MFLMLLHFKQVGLRKYAVVAGFGGGGVNTRIKGAHINFLLISFGVFALPMGVIPSSRRRGGSRKPNSYDKL